MMGLGISSAKASSSPLEAIQVAAPLLAGSPASVGNNYDASYYDSGAELAGLVHAYRSGANTSTVLTAINNLTSDILATGPTFGGDQAYGLVQSGQLTKSATTLNAVGTFYTSGYQASGPFANFQEYADYVGSQSGDPTQPNNDGTENGVVWDLGFHVLATHTLGSGYESQNAAFASTLLTELGYFDTSVGDITAGEFSPTEVLAVALWGLQESGYDSATTFTAAGGGTWGNKSLATLLVELQAKLDADIASGSIFTEDLSYGILALQAYGIDTSTYQDILASGVSAAGLTPTGAVPQSIDTISPYSYNGGTVVGAAYAGAALQALPEPASLSLLGLAGMGLLARRRRA